MDIKRPLAPAALALAATLALVGCGSQPADGNGTSGSPAASATSAAPTSVTIEDNRGSHTVEVPPTSVAAFDNRTFETLSDWGVTLSVAAVSLMPATIAYTQDDSIVDVGTHNEPNLELIVAADPDVVIIGQRFTQFYDDIAALVPDATLIELDPRDGEPFADELKRQVTVLGEVFSKQAEAQQLVDDYDAAMARVKAAYDPAQTAMAVNVSGGEIGFIAPGQGRTLGPVFTDAGLTPALEVEESSTNHEGDEISVEAIAASNPEWILVMDRSAAVDADNPDFKPAAEIIEATDALRNVPAIQKGQVVYMPADTYTNEGIQTYTEFLNDFADALEAAKQG
ncbi:iron complex transport system substrate-binding protein [Tessaracoccus bendigoensis DSM 12906]|uniref:Iron complex transport system substrate-binding protein n=1 Tax=Tessaracoccus bendigoensis DSM 12906 TaxID=1123357 RepID=A0A1M6MI58_9ACTN|nr:ABC transporter substrate-binding protein [Tessaracoccus bendigoensis]SHJ83096.1 iron complex transport system substrate-binding protein [Tessaracoccus bendigoensis DSM 12906]